VASRKLLVLIANSYRQGGIRKKGGTAGAPRPCRSALAVPLFQTRQPAVGSWLL